MKRASFICKRVQYTGILKFTDKPLNFVPNTLYNNFTNVAFKMITLILVKKADRKLFSKYSNMTSS